MTIRRRKILFNKITERHKEVTRVGKEICDSFYCKKINGRRGELEFDEDRSRISVTSKRISEAVRENNNDNNIAISKKDKKNA